MPTPFGPRLIGETEKTLDALLRGVLHGAALTEPEWVVLRLADAKEAAARAEALVAHVRERAHFEDAADLVAGLSERGLLEAGRLTGDGAALVARLQADIAALTAPVWRALPPEDVAAAERLLNTVVSRSRRILAETGAGRPDGSH